ncbi:MAG: hypothetical protein ACI8TX_000917 [Hyphomicrobiaceae bacterium]|jgi:hypothetical protein
MNRFPTTTVSPFISVFFFLAALVLVPAVGHAVPAVGDTAPAFQLLGADGREHSLAESDGKIVVLEWLNHGCPFVRKHYESGNMQSLQKKYTGQGVIWYSIVSSAPGKQGHCETDEAAAQEIDHDSAASAVLLDPEGVVGRAYGARTTPHMFVVAADGKLAYKGAIDDTPSADPNDVAEAKNYVSAAVDALLAGDAVAEVTTTPYGCSVKY